jgi:hypothetical protein
MTRIAVCVNIVAMSTQSHTPRFVLFPQAKTDDGRSPASPVRRYSLARLHLSPRRPGEARYAYLTRTHD